MAKTEAPEAWLDPERDDVVIPQAASLTQAALVSPSAGILGEPLVLQRLITTGGVNLQSANGDQPDSLESWGHTLPSFAAVLLPPAALPPNQQRARRRHQELLLKAQVRWPDLASTSNSAYLLCADDQRPEVGLPAQLYPGHSPDDLLDHQGFPFLINQMISAVSPVVAPAWLNSRIGLSEALTTIVAETFKNTHDHGRTGIDQADVSPSLRGLYARYYDLEEVKRLTAGRKNETLSPALRFAATFIPQQRPTRERWPNPVPVSGVLELSVFDSGPGMASKWLNRPVESVPAGEQLEAVRSCFSKGQTTTGTLGRGFGLAKVLLKLRELHGFIGVRTNQLQLYRQFGWGADIGHVELAGGMRIPKEALFDWKRQFVQSATERLSVKGTVVSFLLPMGSP